MDVKRGLACEVGISSSNDLIPMVSSFNVESQYLLFVFATYVLDY